jgi:alkanesulfonate monooxygenase SsuD/methylene tetrahydromethanopterin reductase-like flavin-dependent oxidoreductase (luciferase family)
MLDEALEILTVAWSGAPVHHRGRHYTVEGIQFLPRPVQQPGVPVWVAGFPGNVKPLRRAARHDGFFPANLEHPDQFAEIVATVTDLRQHTTAPYDFAVGLPPGIDPAPMPRRAPPGGWSSSRGTRCRLTACAACFATARGGA